MENKDERYLNITLKNDEPNQDEVIISFGTIFKMLKKFVAIWLVLAIIAGILVPVYVIVTHKTPKKNLTAYVGFNYSGIENGNDPNGNPFNVESSLNNPAVIEAALTELDLPLTDVETIHQNISIYGVIPEKAYQEIVMYKNTYEENKNVAVGEKMLAVSYNPVKYRVEFDASGAGFDNETGVNVINTILEKYRDYFFEQYGYHPALGISVAAVDYSTYDYAQAIDIFTNSLNTLRRYASSLSQNDKTNFRSAVTGYTFADLIAEIDTLKTVDLDQISSYIAVNNVTKDKTALIDYYSYRIETLAREKNIAQEQLNQLNTLIESYVKDTVIIYSDQEAAQYAQASEEYDTLFEKKMTAQSEVSTAAQEISMYQQRVNALKGKAVAEQEKMDKVENDMTVLNDKINTIINDVDVTANDYFDTVGLGNAYNVLIPAAVSSAENGAFDVVNVAKMPLLIVEALILVVYLAAAFVMSLVSDNRRKFLDKMSDSADAEKSVTNHSNPVIKES